MTSTTNRPSVMSADGHIHTVTDLTDTLARCSCGATAHGANAQETRLNIWRHLNS